MTGLKVSFMYENQFGQVEHQSTKICILLIYISGMVIPIESFMILTDYKKIKILPSSSKILRYVLTTASLYDPSFCPTEKSFIF